MTQKLLLAEGLDLLRQCEQREYDIDRTKIRLREGSRDHRELCRLVQSYDTVFQAYVRGIRMLNYVRHTALADTSPKNAQYNSNLSEFCAGKMAAYLTRCDNVLHKTDRILLPLDQMDCITKEGYTLESTLYQQDGATYPLSRKEKLLLKEFAVGPGTYVLILKNRDDYTLAAPEVEVQLTVHHQQRGGTLEPSHVELKLPCQCGWRKVVGVVETAMVRLELRYSGLRDAHIDVLFQKWCAIEDIGGGPGRALPTSMFDGADFNLARKPTPPPPNAGPANGGNSLGAYTSSPLPPPPPPSSLTPLGGLSNGSPGGYGAPSLPPTQPPQRWMEQLPPLPDDDLAMLANYKVPSTELPARPHHRPDGVAPPASSEDTWAALTNLNVPHVISTRESPYGASIAEVPEPIEVNPPGLSCRQRLDKIHRVMDAWPTSGVAACALPAEGQRMVQAVYSMPYPRELNE